MQMRRLDLVIAAAILASGAVYAQDAGSATITYEPDTPAATTPAPAEAAPAPTAPAPEPAGQGTAQITETPVTPAPAAAEPAVEEAPTVKLPLPVNLDPRFDKQGLVEFSRGLLQQGALIPLIGGLEPDGKHDVAHTLKLDLPNGDKAALVTIGFFGPPTRGYHFIYRVHNGTVQLVQLARGMEWGVTCQETCKEIEPMFVRMGRNAPLLRLTGWTRPSPRTMTAGHFTLFQVTEDGLRAVFTGAELVEDADKDKVRRRMRYTYRDLDGDGMPEIVEDGEQCDYRVPDADSIQAVASNCRSVRSVYRYDGQVFALTNGF